MLRNQQPQRGFDRRARSFDVTRHQGIGSGFAVYPVCGHCRADSDDGIGLQVIECDQHFFDGDFDSVIDSHVSAGPFRLFLFSRLVSMPRSQTIRQPYATERIPTRNQNAS
ncbi:MAG TPA: hypothetical protein VH583_01215 [Vicinamibacterales bacterium]